MLKKSIWPGLMGSKARKTRGIAMYTEVEDAHLQETRSKIGAKEAGRPIIVTFFWAPFIAQFFVFTNYINSAPLIIFFSKYWPSLCFLLILILMMERFSFISFREKQELSRLRQETEKYKTERQFRYYAFNANSQDLLNIENKFNCFFRDDASQIRGIKVEQLINAVKHPSYAGMLTAALLKCLSTKLSSLIENSQESLILRTAQSLSEINNASVVEDFLLGVSKKDADIAKRLEEAMKAKKKTKATS